MGDVRAGGRSSYLYLARRRAFLNPRKAELVMPGLDPGIHVLFHGREKKPWMAGSSSAKTRFALLPGHDGRSISGNV
jgi:hypothetical protein